MPSKKTTKSKTTTHKATPVKLTKQSYNDDISYDTKLIIVLLLLLFFYPVGLIFMWVWMKNWKWWAKLIITLPLILGVLAAIAAIIAFHALISHARYEQMRMEQYRIQRQQQMMQNNSSNSGQFYMSMTPTSLPSANSY